MITLTIDRRTVQVADGATLLEAATAAGIYTPTLCHHPNMHTGSNCRACVVELEGSRTLVPSCSRPAAEGMQVRTDSERVRLSRRMIFELLLSEVDLSAAPEFQAYAAYYGAEPDRFPIPRSAAKDRELIRDNPFFVRDYARCIACRRCVQACGDDAQFTFAIAMVGRGHEISVGAGSSAEDNDLSRSPCVFCGNCVGACPTGALMPLTEYELRLPVPSLTWTPERGFSD